MRGIVWHGPEEMSVEEVATPEVGPGMVVVRPEATGICGSEIEGYLGKMGNRTPPLVMGHEFAGTVTEVGEGADDGLIGRTVAVNPLSSDGTCALCRAGLTNLCPNRRLVGIHSPGGFAEYTLAPAANVYPLPDGVDARTGALAEPLANGVHAARLGTAGGHPVEHAVVIGAGTSGTFCGVSRAMRKHNRNVLCVLVEPEGSIYGGNPPGPKKIEGIGQRDFIPKIFDRSLADEILMVQDEEVCAALKNIAKLEGLLGGWSSGAAAAASYKIAERLGPGKRVVTVFPDGAERYRSQGIFDE